MVSASNCRRGRCCRIEEWRDVIGFEDNYQVSNLGRVRSKDHVTIHKDGRVNCYKGKILSLSLNSQGYQKAMFSVNGKHHTPRICRVVAEAFIPNPLGLPQVNHKDEVKANDRVDNLEWCTAKYNVNYGHRGEKCSEKTSIPVVQMDMSGNVIREWKSAKEAELATGIDHSHIARCCRGKLGQTGGFKWKYKNKTI